LPTSAQQQLEPGCQRQSAASLLPTARLQRQTVRFGFAQISL
jgi:hypothetical protein